MVNKRMILFTKRLRSKAPSAAPLSPVQFADRQGIGFISCQLFIVTQSPRGRGYQMNSLNNLPLPFGERIKVRGPLPIPAFLVAEGLITH